MVVLSVVDIYAMVCQYSISMSSKSNPITLNNVILLVGTTDKVAQSSN